MRHYAVTVATLEDKILQRAVAEVLNAVYEEDFVGFSYGFQRPTQKAMGQGAVRSQMDVRICFRVRERKDVDLILGQGMLTAGWNAHTLNAPGKFLIAAAEHDTPRRARAYLLTDEAVTGTASRYAHCRSPLDEVSQQAISEHWRAEPPDTPGQDTPQENDEAGNGSPGTSPEAILWAALCLAPDEGVPVPDLMHQTGMGRRWVYYRLTDLAAAGRATQVTRGQWRATPDGDDE